MELDLFAGMRVSDYEAAERWYERLLGSEPAFVPLTVFVDDRDADGNEIGFGGPPA